MATQEQALEDITFSSSTHYLFKVNVLESNLTSWQEDVIFASGSVQIDINNESPHRRKLSLVLAEEDVEVSPQDGLWYDKIIDCYIGIRLDSGDDYWTRIGRFMVERIDTDSFPGHIAITGKDLAKKLDLSQFAFTTSFAKGTLLETVINAIAVNAGITEINFPVTEKSIDKDFIFESGTNRGKAIYDLCTNYGYECYFDRYGNLTMRAFQDPLLTPASTSLTMGAPAGIVAHYRKSANDVRLFNHVVVVGEGAGAIPVIVEVFNDRPESPTNIDRIGQRTFRYASKFISTRAQALEVANNLLSVSALEEFSVDIETLVLPWLEGGDIIEVIDPQPFQDQPSKFLLSSFTVPMSLSTMNITARRADEVSS